MKMLVQPKEVNVRHKNTSRNCKESTSYSTSNALRNEGVYHISHLATCTFQPSSFVHSVITSIHGNIFVPQVPWYRGTRGARVPRQINGTP